MEHIWKHNGCELSFDISDSGCMKRLGDALEPLRAGYAEMESEKIRTHEQIDRVCMLIGRFFGTVFGEDCVSLICGERNSLEAYTGAYVDFILFVNDQLEALAKFRAEIEKRVTDRFAGRIANLGGELTEGE